MAVMPYLTQFYKVLFPYKTPISKGNLM